MPDPAPIRGRWTAWPRVFAAWRRARALLSSATLLLIDLMFIITLSCVVRLVIIWL